MNTVRAMIAAAALAGSAAGQQLVSFPTQDGGLIYADLYGKGDRAVVLAHGGRFNRASWEKQATTLEAAGFCVLAIDFRGEGDSRGPGQADPMGPPLHWMCSAQSAT
jgi:alpha-beta hydrolase superfamily lysophospholipase